MNGLTRILVWLRRLPHSRGFGVQSPTDYWLVRYVVNEHWPYYQYSELGAADGWLARKLGRLYFRLANWRQPAVIVAPTEAARYAQAGCRRARVVAPADAPRTELTLLRLEGDYRAAFGQAVAKADDQSVVVIEGIWRDRDFWQQVVADERTGVTFDLYYCGIVMFDKKRAKQNYIINF